MNKQIVALLRVHDNPACLYAAQRIEELEHKLKTSRELLDELEMLLDMERWDDYRMVIMTKDRDRALTIVRMLKERLER